MKTFNTSKLSGAQDPYRTARWASIGGTKGGRGTHKYSYIVHARRLMHG
jgi:hypothetical protein